MAETIAFELVSPESVLVDEPVEMVVVPGGEGDFGVLPRHAPMISAVRPGLIDMYRGGAVTRQIFVAGAVAEVTPRRCTVLAERVIELAELDRTNIEDDLRHAKDHIEGAVSDEELQEAEQEVALYEAMLRALEHKR